MAAPEGDFQLIESSLHIIAVSAPDRFMTHIAMLDVDDKAAVGQGGGGSDPDRQPSSAYGVIDTCPTLLFSLRRDHRKDERQ